MRDTKNNPPVLDVRFVDVYAMFMMTMARVIEERGGGEWACFDSDLTDPETGETTFAGVAFVICNERLATWFREQLIRVDEAAGFEVPKTMAEPHLEMLHDMTRRAFREHGFATITYKRNRKTKDDPPDAKSN